MNLKALEKKLIAQSGPGQVVLLKDWVNLIESSKSLDEEYKLNNINDFINQNILFDSDSIIWNKKDYWATPLETIGKGCGDCEDFAIIKYVSLYLAGIPRNKLRFIYAKTRSQAHIVLAYYANHDIEPVILDNLENSILPVSSRSDLELIFSFNADGIFSGISGEDEVSESNLSRWDDALYSIENDNYE